MCKNVFWRGNYRLFLTQTRGKGHGVFLENCLSNTLQQNNTFCWAWSFDRLHPRAYRQVEKIEQKKGRRKVTKNVLLEIHTITKYTLLQFYCSYNITTTLKYYYDSTLLQKVPKKFQKGSSIKDQKDQKATLLKNLKGSILKDHKRFIQIVCYLFKFTAVILTYFFDGLQISF